MLQIALVYNEAQKFCLALVCYLHKSILSYTQLYHLYQRDFYPLFLKLHPIILLAGL